MVERPRELYPHILVAAIAQLRRLLFHQELAFLGLVWSVAINARDAVGQVHGAVIVPMLFGVLVAAQAAGASLLRCGILKGEDFGLVTSAVDVLFSRAMTGLAALPLHAFVRVELPVHAGCEMGCSGEMRIDLLVAALASVGSHIEVRIRWRNICFGLIRRLGLLGGVLLAARLGKRNHQRRNQDRQKV